MLGDRLDSVAVDEWTETCAAVPAVLAWDMQQDMKVPRACCHWPVAVTHYEHESSQLTTWQE